jgi:carboxyl-terminal processing protease
MEEQKNNNRSWIRTIVLMILAFTLGYSINSFVVIDKNDTGLTSRRVIRKIQLMERYIDKYFLDEVDVEQQEDYMYKGMMAGLDDVYSGYYTKEEYEDMKESRSGQYCGIGCVISQDAETGKFSVVKTYTNSPAEQAGLLAGDVLVAVDGEKLTDEDINQLVSKIKGEEGTIVKLKIYRKSIKQRKTLEIERAQIEEDTVAYSMLRNQVGYVAVSSFEEVTTQQFIDAVEDLEQRGMQKMIIDLRNNGGGLLTTVSDMLDYMLPKGSVLVTTKNKEGKGQTIKAKTKHQFALPLVVLVNGESASASELFAGAIKDYGIGTLVGTTTFGKGIVQNVYPLPDGSAIKLTESKYYTPSGNNIHETGIKPDVEIDLPEEQLEMSEVPLWEDVQVLKALEVLE